MNLGNTTRELYRFVPAVRVKGHKQSETIEFVCRSVGLTSRPQQLLTLVVANLTKIRSNPI